MDDRAYEQAYLSVSTAQLVSNEQFLPPPVQLPENSPPIFEKEHAAYNDNPPT
jgi:hypothetical protein